MMMHALYIRCTHPAEVLDAVVRGLHEQGVTLQGMMLSVTERETEVHVTLSGEDVAVQGLMNRIADLPSLPCVQDLSAQEQEWFVTTQICEVYS